MHWIYIIRSLGLLFATFSVTLCPPIGVAIWYEEPISYVFIITALITLTLGLILWFPTRNIKQDPGIKDGFLIVVLFWATFCMVGAVPYMLSANPDISWIDAIFESVSGLTATGATILTQLDALPRTLLYYRQQTQFLGGMGVILLAIAILPALGVGGMQLFKAEFTGPTKDNKLTPRIAQSAKAIWMIYVGLTVFCAIAYWAAGMELFDAIGYSFGTVSTGGYATHDQSIGYFQSPAIQYIAMFFMFLGGANFSLHFITAHYATLRHYIQDVEFRTYSMIILVGTALVALTLQHHNQFQNAFISFTESAFHVVSLCTTTGLSSSSHHGWPLFIPMLLLLVGVVGGCAGSTSGGIKIVRILLLNKQGYREIKRLIHPNACFVIKFGRMPLSERVINAIWGYLAVYMAMFGLFLILLLATGLDIITAYSATAATLSNIGPGLGDVASNYQSINDTAKVLLSVAMFIGRLELFTVLVLLTPSYWQS